MSRNNKNRGVSAAMHAASKSARRTDPRPVFLRRIGRSARLLTCGMLLQASGCTFDAEAFVGDSLAALFDNIATTLIITALSDLLGVAPTFGF